MQTDIDAVKSHPSEAFNMDGANRGGRLKMSALITISCYIDFVKRLLQFRSSLRLSRSRLSY